MSDFIESIVSQFMPCVCHIDHTKCQNPECVGYRTAIDCVNDDMTPQQAINAIVSDSKLSAEEASHYVSSMVDIGFLDGKQAKERVIQFSEIIGKSQVIALLEQDNQQRLK